MTYAQKYRERISRQLTPQRRQSIHSSPPVFGNYGSADRLPLNELDVQILACLFDMDDDTDNQFSMDLGDLFETELPQNLLECDNDQDMRNILSEFEINNHGIY